MTRYERLLIYFMEKPIVHHIAIWLWSRKLARELRTSLNDYFKVGGSK